MNKDQKKILIVEDDVQISKVYEIQLKKEGFQTVTAHNGEDAIKMLIDENPDLVTLDLMIPKKDGFEVLEDIRDNHKDIKIPIVVISNLGQAGDKERVLSLGATEFLVKTDHSIQEIMNKIKGYLNV